MDNELIVVDGDVNNDLAASNEHALSDEVELQMPDLSMFDDMPELQPRIQRLFEEFINNREFRDAVRAHAEMGLRMDRGGNVAGPMIDEKGEFHFTMTMDEFRTSMIFESTGGMLPNMIGLLQNLLKDIEAIFDGTNATGKSPSFEEMLASKDYKATQMMQIIRYMRILPVYKHMLDTLIQIRDRRNIVYEQINAVIDGADPSGLSQTEEQRVEQLQASVGGNAVDELKANLRDTQFLTFQDGDDRETNE